MAADAMLAEGHDGRVPMTCTFGTFVPGVWQPLADADGAAVCDPTPWVKDAVPFLVESATQFRTPGPLALTSAAYAAEVNEVKAIGALNSTTRTPAQSHAAAFWQTNPMPNYNAIARRFADLYSLDLSDSARLFAMLDLTAADALITTWSRQVPLQLLAAEGRNPAGGHRRQSRHGGRPHLGADVPSDAQSRDRRCRSRPEHAAVPGPSVGRHRLRECQHARAGVLLRYRRAAVLCDEQPVPGEQRAFTRFSDVTNEVLEARIWAGIHFRTPDVQSAELGGEIERYIHKHWFAAAH